VGAKSIAHGEISAELRVLSTECGEIRVEDRNLKEENQQQMDPDSFSARIAKTCPKGMKTSICDNLRKSAVNNSAGFVPYRHRGSRGLVQGDGVDNAPFFFNSGLSLSASVDEEAHEVSKIATQNTKIHFM